MAYRQPGERRDRAGDMTATSYLENFLEQIAILPTKTLDTVDQIRQLDDRIDSLISEADTAAACAINRSTVKGMPMENARRSYSEFVHFQKDATELADKKVALACSTRDSVDAVISDVDRRLVEFEAHLRKEGRWPGTTGKKPVTPRFLPAKGNPVRTGCAKAPRAAVAKDKLSKPSLAIPLPSTRGIQKSRNRDNLPAKGRVSAGSTRSSAGATRTAQTKAQKAVVPPPDDGDIIMDEGNAAASDATDSAALDTTLYCTCRNISHGEMICCEDDNCPVEWFHFECVGLTEAPEGAWYCDDCTEKMVKRKGGHRRKATT